MIPADLEDMVDLVEDQKSFLAFLGALAEDFALKRRIEAESPSPPYGPGALGWENGAVDTVFDAAFSWGTNSSEAWESGADVNVWRRCANILLAGKYYE